jgi:hypothetical protein
MIKVTNFDLFGKMVGCIRSSGRSVAFSNLPPTRKTPSASKNGLRDVMEFPVGNSFPVFSQ